jgi:hypothetical protein
VPDAAGSVPEEMFFGREEETERLADPDGPSLVCGPRQSGKSALLARLARTRSRPEHGSYVLYRHAGGASTFEEAVCGALARAGLAPEGLDCGCLADQIGRLLPADARGPYRRITVIVDGCDALLDAERARGYAGLAPFAGASAAAGGRFRLILGGGLPVLRLALRPGGPFGSSPALALGPLAPEDAWRLAALPLAAMGMEFNPPSAAARLLERTGCSPGLLQLCLQEVAGHARTLLLGSLATFENELELDIGRHRQKLSTLTENPKLIDAVAVLEAGVAATGAIDDAIRADLYRMVVHFLAGENPSIWSLRAAAAISFGEGTYATALTFIARLAVVDADFGIQAFALGFNSISKLLPQFPKESAIPVFLVWCAILGACHSNLMLRRSSLQLLSKVIPFALENAGFANINDMSRTRGVSHHFQEGLSLFEEDQHVDFTANFAFAFAVSLRKALEEVVTRSYAVSLLKLCIKLSPPSIGVFFMLPVIAYSPEDPLMVVAQIAPDSSGVGDFLFTDFENRPAKEQSDIVLYLADAFGNRYSAQRMESIAECLIWGAERYSEVFAGVRAALMDKCSKMLPAEKNPARLDRISAVQAEFYELPAGTKPVAPMSSKLVDDNLTTYLNGVVTGVAEVLAMNIRLPLQL